MLRQSYEKLHQLIKQRSGMCIEEDKIYLLESRLMPVIKKHNFSNIDTLVNKLITHPNSEITQDIVEAIATHETFFFRDQMPFVILKNTMIPTILNSNSQITNLRILCAACSSGQEAYSVAMLVKEEIQKTRPLHYEIVAFDVSSKIVEEAKQGIYNAMEIQRGLPLNYRQKYFEEISKDTWQIKLEIRNMVQFTQSNLMYDLSKMGKFDIIFCRNVLIYFDKPAKIRILSNLYNVLQPHGYLCIGNSETLMGIESLFAPIEHQRGIYRPTSDKLRMSVKNK